MTESPKPVTSAANPAVKRLKSLAAKKYRDEEGAFLVEGLRHINDGLSGGFTLDILAWSPRAGAEAAALAKQAKGECLSVTDDLLSRITGRDNTQLVIAAFRQKFADIQDI